PDHAADRDPEALAAAVAELVAGGASRRDAVAEVADRLGVPRRSVYNAAHGRRHGGGDGARGRRSRLSAGGHRLTGMDTMKRVEQVQRARALTALHVPGDPLLLPNAWDAASAHVIARAGAKAIATSSASCAWSTGHADGDRM